MKKLAAMCALLILPGAAGAATLGSVNIADSAFADKIVVTSGTLRTYDSTVAPTVLDALSPTEAGVGPEVGTGIWCTAACTFDALFLDNHVVNGAGADLAIFEGGGNESLAITINAISRTLAFDADIEEAGFVDGEGAQIGYWLVDLDDFGVAPGASISAISFDLLFGDRGRTGDFASADLVAVGALNSAVVPLPPSLALLFAGFGGLVALRRRK